MGFVLLIQIAGNLKLNTQSHALASVCWRFDEWISAVSNFRASLFKFQSHFNTGAVNNNLQSSNIIALHSLIQLTLNFNSSIV
jgi:hypothetical protein